MTIEKIDLFLPIQTYRDGDLLLVTQKSHVPMLLGNTSITGNECLFDIKKRPDGMISIPISVIRREYDKWTKRVQNINSKVAVLHIVLKELGDIDE